MTGKFIIAAIPLAVLASSAQAATLKNVSGTVMVNKGNGFREVTAGTTVNNGDRILVPGNGAVQVDFGGGCVASPPAGQSSVVSSSASCGAASMSPGDAAFGALDDPLVVGGIATAAVVAGVAIIATQDNDDEKPASP